MEQEPVLLLLAGIVAGYVAFFVCPVFLNPDRTMKFLPYIVKIDPIGLDLAQMLDYSRAWFVRGQSPYVGANLYPPGAVVLFVPFLCVNAVTAYHLMTLINLICYGGCVFLLPWLVFKDRERLPVLLAVFFSGLFSYGFHFELERGQFNLLACAGYVWAIYLFHHHKRLRFLSYGLFCLAVQLKIYPAIFIILFISDWRDWRTNLRRITGLFAVNVGLLFVLGPRIFQDFLRALARESSSNLWIGNHSIRAFVLLAPLPAEWFFRLLLYALVAACIGGIIVVSYRQRLTGFHAPLFLGCTVAALLLPSVSNDYTLTLLTVAMSLAFPHRQRMLSKAKKTISRGLLLSIAVAYTSTLYSFTNKPRILRNNMPALLIILCAWTIWVVFLQNAAFRSAVSDDEEWSKAVDGT